MRERTRQIVTCSLLAALIGLPAGASARMAVVTAADADGNPAPFPYALPEGHGGTVPLSWSYVTELVPLVAAGATLDEACDESEPPSINVIVAQAMQMMASMDIEGAVDTLDGLLADLPCLDSPITPLELARIFYYRGAALAFLGDFDGAAASMGQALAVDEALDGDPNLPPEIDDLFDQQRRARSRGTYAPLTLLLPRGVDARLDGVEADIRIDLSGAGLLQWQQEDGTWRSVRLDQPGDEVIVGTTAGLRAHLADGDPEVARVASTLSESIADALRVQSVLLYDGADGALLWRAEDRTTEWLDLLALDDGPDVRIGSGDPSPRPDRPRTRGRSKPPPPPTDTVRLAFGGGIHYLHPFPYATANVDGTFQLYRALCIGLGVDLGFPVTGYRDPVILPVGHVGLRVRLGGKVQPWFGVAYRVGLDDRPGVTWAPMGIGVEVGVDIPMTGMLLLRVGGQGGAMGIPDAVFQAGGNLSFVLGF